MGQPKVMDFRELSAFVAVVEEGGMSAASRRLHVSQSALSQTVSALERELGVSLLERTSTGVRPTEAGTALLVEARAVLARYHQAVRTMSTYSTGSSAVIRLGIPMELDPDVLPTALAKFAAGIAKHARRSATPLDGRTNQGIAQRSTRRRSGP